MIASRLWQSEHLHKIISGKETALEMGNTDEIMLVTLGSEEPKRIRSPTTKLDIVLKDGSILQINANVVPQIAGSIQRHPVDLKSFRNWDYLWGEFPLADDLPKEIEPSSVELLIGNDYYLDIILPQKIEVQAGLYMLGSKWGGYYQEGHQKLQMKHQRPVN